MAQTQRQYDFTAGTTARSQQVDDELTNLVNAHNTLDTDVTTHKARVDNPHSVTAAQTGAYSKTESDAKFETITNVDNKLVSQKSDLAGTGRTTETIKGVNDSLNTHKMATTLDHPDGSVTTAKIADNAVNTMKIADSSISTTKMADLNVTTAKLADSSVTTAKLVNQSVTRDKIAPGAVGANEIDSSLTTYVELNTHKSKSVLDHPDGSVTYEKLSNDVQLRFTSLESDIGDPSTLTTTNKTSAVGAINELSDQIGILPNLQTTEKGNLVGAVNEVRTTANNAIPSSQKGVANGVAQLGPDQKVLTAQLPPIADNDKGRYQAEFGFDTSEITASIPDIDKSVEQLTTSGTTFALYDGNGVGQRFYPALTADIDVIDSFSFIVNRTGTATWLKVEVWDSTQNIKLGEKTSYYSSMTMSATVFSEIVFDSPIEFTRGNQLDIRIIEHQGLTSANYFMIQFTSTDSIANSVKINTVDTWTTVSEDTARDMMFKLKYRTKQLTSTATKTITPSDLKKWGNLKWEQTGDVVVDVLSAADAVLKSNITSIADLSDIDITQYPSLKVRWTLSRNATTDPSPTVKNPSVTWEGKNMGVWERIADVTLSAAVAQVDFTGLSAYEIIMLHATLNTQGASFQMKFNDYSGVNYYHDHIDQSGTTVSGGANTGLANIPQAKDLEITIYPNDKFLHYKARYFNGSRYQGVGQYQCTDASVTVLDKLSFASSAADILSGTKFKVLGLK